MTLLQNRLMQRPKAAGLSLEMDLTNFRLQLTSLQDERQICSFESIGECAENHGLDWWMSKFLLRVK